MHMREEELHRRLSLIEHRLSSIEQYLGAPKGPDQTAVSPDVVLQSPSATGTVSPEDLPVLPANARAADALLRVPTLVDDPTTPPASHTQPPRAPARDWENRIGADWLNRIGIAAVLIGCAYFLKYAFENRWIGPAGRVALGLFTGLAILVWAERLLRRGHRTFSCSMVVLSVGILYLSIWASSQMYQLVPVGVAFGGMLLVTAMLTAFSLRHRAEFIAALALTSGFLTPVLLSTHANQALELFSYIALLDLAALVLLFLHPWYRLLIVSFIGSASLFTAWYGAWYGVEQRGLATIAATLFFLIFAAVPFIRSRSRVERRAIPRFLGVVLMTNAAWFFTAQLLAMYKDDSSRAILALLLAAFHLLVASLLAKLSTAGWRDFLVRFYALIGIALLAVAVPFEFSGYMVTVGWLIEAAVLLMVGARSGRTYFARAGGIILTAATWVLLTVDAYPPGILLLNISVAVHLFAAAIFAVIAWQQRRVREALYKFSVIMVATICLVAATREVTAWFALHMPDANVAKEFTYSAVWMTFAAFMMILGFIREAPFIRKIALAILGFTIVKVFLFDLSALDRGYRIISFIVLGVLLLAISFVYQKRAGADGSRASPQP